MAARADVARLLAWGVHFYTALGLVIAGAIAYLLVGQGEERFAQAFLLMALATFIDATDGFLARKARVKEVLPNFDGRRLDDIVDFLNYTFLPLLLLFEAQLLSGWQNAWLLLPLLASAYGFCQVSAKTSDGFFLGFPSYWNLVAFYLFMLHPPPTLTIALLTMFAVLTFVPLRYLYPSQPGRLNRWSNYLGLAWGLALVAILWGLTAGVLSSDRLRQLTGWSLVYPGYYLLASWTISVRFWLAQRRAGEPATS